MKCFIGSDNTATFQSPLVNYPANNWGVPGKYLGTTWGLLSHYLGAFAPISDHWPLNDLNSGAYLCPLGSTWPRFFSSPSGNQGATAISKGIARQSLVTLGDVLLKKKWFLSDIARITLWTPWVHFILKKNQKFVSTIYSGPWFNLQNCEYINWLESWAK